MRSRYAESVERCRVQMPSMRTKPGDGWGHFLLPTSTKATHRNHPDELLCMVGPADLEGWAHHGFPPPAFDHVSVSVRRGGKPFPRCPTWEEMCLVKAAFFDDEELAIQFHPPKSASVNAHPYCLHLWKPVGVTIPLPPRGTMA